MSSVATHGSKVVQFVQVADDGEVAVVTGVIQATRVFQFQTAPADGWDVPDQSASKWKTFDGEISNLASQPGDGRFGSFSACQTLTRQSISPVTAAALIAMAKI